MDSIRTLAVVLLLCSIHVSTLSAERSPGLDLNIEDSVESQSIPATIQPINISLIGSSNFRSNGLLLDSSPSVAANILLISPETSPTIFHTGHWFATASVASMNLEVAPGETVSTVGAAGIGMVGKLMPDCNVRYAWAISRNMTNISGDSSSIFAGLYMPLSKNHSVGAAVQHSFNAPGEQTMYSEIFYAYRFAPTVKVQVQHGWQEAANGASKYSYEELNISKQWTKEWSTDASYFFVRSGKNFNDNFTKDGLQVSTKYSF
jgi:hypothetical protein